MSNTNDLYLEIGQAKNDINTAAISISKNKKKSLVLERVSGADSIEVELPSSMVAVDALPTNLSEEYPKHLIYLINGQLYYITSIYEGAQISSGVNGYKIKRIDGLDVSIDSSGHPFTTSNYIQASNAPDPQRTCILVLEPGQSAAKWVPVDFISTKGF